MANVPENVNIVQYALDISDREITAEIMSELLMDDGWTTWKMFEGLASDYISGSADVRRGMDLACSALTGWDVAGIAQQIIDRCEE